MFTDATIMCRNLADLNREGIIALPIHDSVIVQAKYESRAVEIMERNLALKSGPHAPPKSAHESASQVADKAQGKAPPHLFPHLQQIGRPKPSNEASGLMPERVPSSAADD